MSNLSAYELQFGCVCSAEQGDCAIAIRLLLLFMRGYNLLLAVIGSIMVSIAHAPTESAGRL